MKNFLNSFSEINLPMHGVRLPVIELSEDFKKGLGLTKESDNFEVLKSLARKGMKTRNINKELKDYDDYVKRAKYELETVNDLGFTDYFLLVWKVIYFCNENKIPVGWGRGSAAGSLILYLIGITQIDPVKYGLLFERFISKTRAKKQVIDGITYIDGSLAPDIDQDVDFYRRSEVLNYLETEFKGKTSKILTFNTLSGKILIKECGKIIGEKSETEMMEVSEMIPKVFGQVRDLQETFDGKKKESGEWEEEPVSEFVTWCKENKEIYEIALKLRGLNKNKSVHPSGVMVSYYNTEDTCPTELTSDKQQVSSFDMEWVSLLNIKLDILGLRSVSIVDDVCKNIGIKPEDIDVNDSIIYQNLQNLKSPHGVFQLEAHTNLQVSNKVKPKNLYELSAVLALARPGALQFVDQYANFTNTGTKGNVHPFFDDILGQTGNLCLYQEQLMKMAVKIGFSLEEAESLRRIVGKKKKKEMEEWKKKVEDKVIQNNLPSEISAIYWKILEDSASYSFNFSHSASYASLSAATAYIKFKYPRQFFLSLLKMTRNEPDPISEITKIEKELSNFRLKLLPPDLVKSEMDFSIEDNNIRFGLMSIKGVSEKTIEKLNKFRNKFSNKFQIFQAAEEAGLNIGILSSCLQAGCLETFGKTRSWLTLECQIWNMLTPREHKLILPLGEQFNYDLVKVIQHLNTITNEKGAKIIKDSRMATMRRDYEPYKQIYLQNKSSEDFANWYYEKTLLGYTYTKSLRDIFLEKNHHLEVIKDVAGKLEKTPVFFVGSIKEFSTGVSKAKKTKYIKMLISDETGDINTMMFNPKDRDGQVQDKIGDCEVLNGRSMKEEDIVIVKGKKMGDSVFADLIAVQSNKIYMKLKDLKNGTKAKEKEVDF